MLSLHHNCEGYNAELYVFPMYISHIDYCPNLQWNINLQIFSSWMWWRSLVTSFFATLGHCQTLSSILIGKWEKSYGKTSRVQKLYPQTHVSRVNNPQKTDKYEGATCISRVSLADAMTEEWRQRKGKGTTCVGVYLSTWVLTYFSEQRPLWPL